MDVLQIVGVLVALLIVAVTVYLLRLRAGGATVARETALLIGPADGGKTTLLALLCTGEPPRRGTVTSMAPHRTACLLKHSAGSKPSNPPKTLPMIDIPGHSRLRRQLIISHAAPCKVVLFVIDSVAFADEMSDVAELLYDTMVVIPDRPILVVCNKQDLFFRASKPDVIQTKLEAEFNVIQKTRAGTLESTDAGDTTARFGSTILGTEGMPFKFADHPNQPVEFIPFVAVDTQAKAPADSSSDSHDTKRIFKWLAQHE